MLVSLPRVSLKPVLAIGLVLLLFGILPGGVADDPPQIPCSDTTPPYTGCPDLFVDVADMRDGGPQTINFSPNHCDVVEGQVTAGLRTVYRFTFTTPNIGDGDLVVGRPTDHPEWFTWSSCHGHYHFREYGDYRLWTLDGYALWSAYRAEDPTRTAEEVFAEHPELEDEFIVGQKQGFCVIDLKRYVPIAGKYFSCSSNQGISVGWADSYNRFLSGQYVDITDVDPGVYMLEAEVNSEHLYIETDYSNNAAAIPIRVF